MKSEIISKFKGTIYGVEIDKESICYTVEFLLENIENRFGEKYLFQKFVEDLVEAIYRAYYKYDSFNFYEFENGINFDVKEFKKLEFQYLEDYYYFEFLNKNIKKGKYIK